MSNIKMIQWDETIMRDSFGDCIDEEFKQVSNAYIEAARELAGPDCEVTIDISACVGSAIGVNRIVWSDGSVIPCADYNDEPFQYAIKQLNEEEAS